VQSITIANPNKISSDQDSTSSFQHMQIKTTSSIPLQEIYNTRLNLRYN